jgi:hypothetical protein
VNCKKLKEVNIPNVTVIGNYCFSGASALTSMTVDLNKLRTIGQAAF